MMEQLCMERWRTMGMLSTGTITLTPQTAGPHQLVITMDGQPVYNNFDVKPKHNYLTLCNPQQVINCSGGPSSIAIHDSGDIYVACNGDNSIHVFDLTGQQKRTIGSAVVFSAPRGICIKGLVVM